MVSFFTLLACRAAAVLAWVLLLTPELANAGAFNTLPTNSGTVVTVRLLSPLSSFSSRPGDEFQAIVVAPVEQDGRILIPRNSIVRGRVAKTTRVGRGFIHERASMQLEFYEWQPPGGDKQPFTARLMEVDNAREQVLENGRIKGILATSGPPGLLLGMWRRPDLSMFGRASIGFSGIAHFTWLQSNFHPAMAPAIAGLRMLLVRFPEPEIHLPAGADLVLSTRSRFQPLPAVPTSLLPSPPAELVSLAAAQPLLTTRGTSGKSADITNLLFIGSREDLEQAFQRSGWFTADTMAPQTVLRGYKAMTTQDAYPTAPVSLLQLHGRPPDLVFQRSLNTIAKRHHIRVWKQPDQYEGREVWVAAATHDTGIRVRAGGMSYTHRIDPYIDRERHKVVEDLSFAGCVEDDDLIDRPDFSDEPYGRISTDGRMAVVRLKACTPTVDLTAASQIPPQRIRPSARLLRRFILENRHAIIRGNLYYLAFQGINSFRKHRQRPILIESAGEDLESPLD
ncbi:LssY C-terminal domain-containing protein [Paludibaculum fermentans]|uniref:LssY C-terminal domain-containing protein n=1 Tax=Paludibaculum fermentans TaxID=1473598 RepID=A0A7S7NPX5_PALFE|nr:LssY C-terminal domain-containing protein [Paludibaculum fermentans]QOY87626.1 LssY C-terminal domain-containing protein [Paludibaculum fermentans]